MRSCTRSRTCTAAYACRGRPATYTQRGYAMMHASRACARGRMSYVHDGVGGSTARSGLPRIRRPAALSLAESLADRGGGGGAGGW
jgi:hypothetical protein